MYCLYKEQMNKWGRRTWNLTLYSYIFFAGGLRSKKAPGGFADSTFDFIKKKTRWMIATAHPHTQKKRSKGDMSLCCQSEPNNRVKADIDVYIYIISISKLCIFYVCHNICRSGHQKRVKQERAFLLLHPFTVLITVVVNLLPHHRAICIFVSSPAILRLAIHLAYFRHKKWENEEYRGNTVFFWTSMQVNKKKKRLKTIFCLVIYVLFLSRCKTFSSSYGYKFKYDKIFTNEFIHDGFVAWYVINQKIWQTLPQFFNIQFYFHDCFRVLRPFYSLYCTLVCKYIEIVQWNIDSRLWYRTSNYFNFLWLSSIQCCEPC